MVSLNEYLNPSGPVPQNNALPPEPPVTTPKPSRIRLFLRLFFALLIIVVIGTAAFLVAKGARTFTVQGTAHLPLGPYENFSIEKEDTRVDVLLLGMRGVGDPDGGLLADTIILASYDTRTRKAAYALGEEKVRGGGGLALSKQMVSYISGVYVDYAVSIDFSGFLKAIDIVGGVSVTRTTPLRETQQWQYEGKENNPYWHKETKTVEVSPATPPVEEATEVPEENAPQEEGENTSSEDIVTSTEDEQAPVPAPQPKTIEQEYWVFEVPKGTHVLSGEDALYYVRSRYTTSDFDRMHRQQEVISSFVRKVLSLGVLANPVRVSELIDALGASVRTDAGIPEIRTAVDVLRSGAWSTIDRHVLDTTNFLVSAHEDSQYVLLTKSGNFDELRSFFQTILDYKSPVEVKE